MDYLHAQGQAAQNVERELRNTLGPDVIEAVYQLLDALSDDEVLPRDYLRAARQRLWHAEE
jgi:uncharacterized protein (UPF0147 family)